MFDRIVELGAIDAELSGDDLAAVMPDRVTPAEIADALGVADVRVSPAAPRDDGSVWVLRPLALDIAGVRIVPAATPADGAADPAALRLIDAAAFGTGLHPTTALCLEAIADAVRLDRPQALLDVGTGSGVLALAALRMGVTRALGIDLDGEALQVAAENARINGLAERLQLAHGGPDAVAGTWPLVVANVLPAPLIEMAAALVRRVAHRGQVVLSGIPVSAERDVEDAYRRLGLHRVRAASRGGWAAVVLRASW